MVEAAKYEPHMRDRDAEAKSNEKDFRLTLRLSPEAREALEWIAKQRNVSYAEVFRRALGTEKFFIEANKKNASILLEEPGQRLKEVILR